MLYLSKITLSPLQERQERLYDIYQLHKKLWKAFEHEGHDKKRDFLYRVDETSSQNKEILLQSCVEPRWQHLFPAQSVQVKSYNPKFHQNQRFLFYLRANAVVAEKREGKKHSVKIPIRPKEYVFPVYDEQDNVVEYQGWLAIQGEKHGFRICEASRMGAAYARGHKKRTHRILLTGQNIQGYLQIIDAAAFMNAYVQGIGRGKAFGFGMLSLIKV